MGERVWVLADDRAGNVGQCLGVAEALGWPFAVKEIRYTRLGALPNLLRIEGHTNSIPVTPGGPYASNWELSTDRATAVVRYLITRGLPAARVSATGYADTRPLVPDSDPAAVSVNRRVDIVVVSTASAEANAQLASLDAAHGN